MLDDSDYVKLRKVGFIEELKVQASDASEPMCDSAKVAEGDGYTAAVLTELLPDVEIERRISERESARRRGDFARADQIRNDLLNVGVILEDTKAGTRWKRK